MTKKYRTGQKGPLAVPRQTSRIAGISLLELLIALGITSLLIANALPSFAPILERYHSRMVQHTVLKAFWDARADAVTHGLPVVICGSGDGVNCDYNWNESMIVFRDNNRDEVFNGEDTMLYRKAIVPEGASLRTYRRYFRVRWMGNLASHPDSFRYCSYSGKERMNWRAAVNRVGKVRIDKRDRDGGPVQCAERT